MESEEFMENWRTHIYNYENLKQSNKKLIPDQYCKSEEINLAAFCFWQDYINQEDKYTYYRSFAFEHLKRAKTALGLLEQYIDIDSRLRMPLMRDAIISYAALFKKSRGRTSSKWQMEKSIFAPPHLNDLHDKLCRDRDIIIAHCDLGARNPKVTKIGIVMKGEGFYWENYKALISPFKELIDAVTNTLEFYLEKENLSSAEKAFQDFNPPPEALRDPGKPKT